MTRTLRRAALPLAVALLAIVAVGLVVLGWAAGVAQDAPAAGSSRLEPSAALVLRTVGVALGIALLATALALLPAWAMRRRSALFAAVMLGPVLLPAYLVYAAWGLARAPGTLLGDLVERSSPAVFTAVNTAQAIIGLSLWAWPIAAILIGVSARRIGRDELDALRSSGRGRLARVGFLLAALRGSVAASVTLLFVMMLGSAVPLHVAGVNTWSIEVWRVLSESATPTTAFRASAPIVLIAAGAGVVFSLRLTRNTKTVERIAPGRDELQPVRGIGRAALVGGLGVWSLSTLAPLLLFVGSLRGTASLGRVGVMLAPDAGRSAVVALAVGGAGVVIAIGARLALASSASRGAHGAGVALLAALVFGALTPGVLVGAGLLSAARFDALAFLVETQLGLVIAHGVRFGVVGAVAGWVWARAEPRDLADLAQQEVGASVVAWVRAIGAPGAGFLLAAALVMALLSFHEIEATVVLAPAGFDSLARTLLNQLHYLRMDELSAAGVWLMGGGLAGAALAGALAARCGLAGAARGGRGLFLLAVVAAPVVGCDETPAPGAAAEVVAVLGEVGRAPGQLVYPRCLDADADGLVLIDKTARVQRWSLHGEPVREWTMPAFGRGKPTGVTIGPDGLIYVADTHEHRVAVFDQAGTLVDGWGAYGEGPGQFIYPTDVAFKTDEAGAVERVYVSEYGGNDRVSVFNADHEFLFAIGGTTSAPQTRIEFARPQSIVFDDRRDRLYVADSSHHRVGVLTPDGAPVRWIGRSDAMPGDAPGEFRYPYGLALLGDGTLLVAEFGGGRLQRVDPRSGAPLGVVGRTGDGAGELRTPWGVAAVGERVFVLDSGHNRVIEIPPPGAVDLRDSRVSAPGAGVGS